MDADKWRYADTLEAVTAESRPYYLDSVANATDVLAAGSLATAKAKGKPSTKSPAAKTKRAAARNTSQIVRRGKR